MGTNLVEYYLQNNFSVLNIDIARPRNSAQTSVWQCVDIMDSTALEIAMVNFAPDFVFHMAARTDLSGRTISDYSVNIDGVKNVISAIKKVGGIQRAIFASSMLVCKLGYIPSHEFDCTPNTPYGESKCRGEEIVRESALDIPWVIVRPTSLWGPWFDIPYRGFFDAVRRGYFFLPRGLDVVRSYGFVSNAVFQLNCLAAAPQASVVGRTFYLADYEPISLRHWAECIRLRFNTRRIPNIPWFVLRFGAVVGDMLRIFGMNNPPLTTVRLNNMITDAVFDMTPLKNVCGNTPYTLDDGVNVTVAWMKNQLSTASQARNT